MAKKPLIFKIRGYVKREGEHYVAVCIDLNLGGQGTTARDAMESLIGAIDSYFEFLLEHPEIRAKHIVRKARLEFRLTYYLIVFMHRTARLKNWWKDSFSFEREVIPSKLQLV